MEITATKKGITAKRITYNAENTFWNIFIIGIFTTLRIKRTTIEKLVGAK